jgi:hypothetical protein
MIHKGSCHCGQMAFEVEGELTQAAVGHFDGRSL